MYNIQVDIFDNDKVWQGFAKVGQKNLALPESAGKNLICPQAFSLCLLKMQKSVQIYIWQNF